MYNLMYTSDLIRPISNKNGGLIFGTVHSIQWIKKEL